MFSRLPPLKTLRAFEAAARHLSFKKAAEELSVTQGAISYQIRNLESHLELTLFQRKIRQVVLTSQGKKLQVVVCRVFKDLLEGVHDIQPSNILTISVSTFFTTRWLSKRLGTFMNQNPEITVRLHHSVNDPDFSIDEVDVAIRWGNGCWSGCCSEELFSSPMIALCAPERIQGKNALKRLDDLPNQIFLHDQPGNDSWREWLALAGYPQLGEGPGPLIVDPNVRVQSAIDGQGLVLGNLLLSTEIQTRQLVEPFPLRLDGFGFHLTYRQGVSNQSLSMRFRDWVIKEVEILK